MHESLKKKIIHENIWKNTLVVVVALASLPFIREKLQTLDGSNTNDFLLVVSILLVTVCFANFAFTYRDSNRRLQTARMLSHVATFFFLLLTALLLLTMSFGIGVAYPEMSLLFYIFSFLLYFAVVLYDFWDILRTS